MRHPLILDALSGEHTGIILSWHDLEGRPKNLIQRAAQLQDVSGIDVVKVAWRARSIRDNLEAFSLLQSRQQPMIALCMGEYGIASRILAPKFGGFATYASIDGKKPTALGQLSVNDLHATYNFSAINKETEVYGVIGNNVEHSASPAFHNTAFQAAEKNAVYIPLSIPDGWEHLKASVLEFCNTPALHFSGASVTVPHKENILRLADSEDINCKKAGAANTITIDGSAVDANNTDVEAIETIASHAKQVLILGGGGVARATIVAMQNIGANVFVATRRPEQGSSLSKEFSIDIATQQNHIDTIINCTPVGMCGGNNPDDDPLQILAKWIKLDPSILVIDTVYKPKETPLIQRAMSNGCKTITGDAMFRLQAAAQQRIWT
jgi:3-dehydroquinate dehydratase/shikimate dehydrogenase